MLDTVQAFFDATAKIHTDYAARVAELNGNLDRSARTRALQRIRDHHVEVAWAELELTDDKLVRFIVRNYANNGYRSQAETVLRALPLDLEGLRDLGREQAWCSDYHRALNTAIREGLVEDGRTPQRRELDLWLRSNWTNDEGQLARLTAFVDAIVAAEAPGAKAADKGAPVPATG